MRRQTFLVFVFFACILVVADVKANCIRCSLPPPCTQAVCGNTYFNGADGCITQGSDCITVGSCEGPGGDQCLNDPNGCVVERWVCGEPLNREWRLESVTIDPATALHDGRSGKEEA